MRQPARAEYELRKVLLGMNAHVLGKPEIYIGMAATKFSAAGELTDETTRKFIGDQMKAFKAWTLRIHGSRVAA